MSSVQTSHNILQHVSRRKLERLSDRIRAYEAKKHNVFAETSKHPDLRRQVSAIIENASQNSIPLGRGGNSVKNIQRFLAQAEYDASVSEKQLREWKNAFGAEIEGRGQKLVYAELFGRLCTEWLQSANNACDDQVNHFTEEADINSDTASTSSSFVPVARKDMQEQREQWEQYAFADCSKDQIAIDVYLKDLFEFTRKSKKLKKSPLHELQLAMGRFEEMEPKRLDGHTVAQCIDGLLRADFFSGAKRQELVEMKAKDEILDEIADVLNMDLDSIDSWSWEKPVPLHQRRQLNGKYRVYYDEEIHQAIFLQWIGMKWAVLFKKAFENFFHSGAWSQAPYRAMDKTSKQRRDYFLGTTGTNVNHSVRAIRRTMYQNEFFMLQLPTSMEHAREDYGDHDNGVSSEVPQNPVQKKDRLHRLITTEMLIQTTEYGECTVLQSDFKWFGPSIPHDTIFAVLKFLGVKGKWLTFFRKFLQAQVYWADGSEGAHLGEEHERQPRQRRRGVPMTHILSDALSEAILFCLDFAVSKATRGADLYRFHDDLWFWGQEEIVVKAWRTIRDFSDMMGLELNLDKTGCVQIFAESTSPRLLPDALPQGPVTWGLLKLDPATRSWIIDSGKVDAHVKELERQLAACASVFAWIQAWNSYACRFLSNNLGHPATCLGTAHVDAVLACFASVQRQLFGPDGSAHGHLRSMIGDPARKLCHTGFDVSGIPDAFFYFPLSVGGLELQNPFVKPLAIRSNIRKTSSAIIAQAVERNEDDFERAKKRFEDGDYICRPMHANGYVPAAGDEEEFMSFEEFSRFGEECNEHLAEAYSELLNVPDMDDPEATPAVRDATGSAGSSGVRWRTLTSYDRWIFELYGGGVINLFGDMSFGERSMLPLGLMENLRSERTRWVG